jgi:electron transfer flavoprotein beta subunit
VERVRPDGYEKVRARLPALITTSNEVGELRYISVKQLVEARKMPCEFWSADDIEIDLQALKKMQIVDMYKPVLQKQCVFVDGGSPQEKGKNLAELLVKDDVIATRS